MYYFAPLAAEAFAMLLCETSTSVGGVQCSVFFLPFAERVSELRKWQHFPPDGRWSSL